MFHWRILRKVVKKTSIILGRGGRGEDLLSSRIVLPLPASLVCLSNAHACMEKESGQMSLNILYIFDTKFEGTKQAEKCHQVL